MFRAVAGNSGVVGQGKAEALVHLPAEPEADGHAVAPGPVTPDAEGGKGVAGKGGIERVVAADKLMEPPDPDLRGDGAVLHPEFLSQLHPQRTDK